MKRVLAFLFCLFAYPFFSQVAVGPHTWQDHLSINSCNSVTRNGSTIYGSYYNGLVFFNEIELNVQTLSKINGLSDIGIRLLRANPYNQKVLVIYDNCNIDIIDGQNNITNFPDIKIKSINGRKIINEVTFIGPLAYLACGFGVVVFDMDKLEIKDTYIIGANASYQNVIRVAFNDSLIFAATSVGMYKAYRNSALINYKNWIYDTVNIAKGYFSGVVSVADTVLCAYSPSVPDPSIKNMDTMYQYTNKGWIKYPPMAKNGNIRAMGPTYKNYFSFSDLTGLWVLNVGSGVSTGHFSSFNGEYDYGTYRDAYVGHDYSGNIAYWIADAHFGLNRTYTYYDPMLKITRNGTNKNTVGNIDINKGRVAISPSLINNTGTGNYSTEGINMLKNGDWSYLKCFQDDGLIVSDVTSVLWDRLDTTRMWICSWYYGVMQYKNNKLIKPSYTPTTTSMPQIAVNEPRCSGLSMDQAGNLWFANSDQKGYLSVIKRDGSYINFTFDVSRSFTRKTFVDKNNNVWLLHERDVGITIYNPYYYANQPFQQPVLNGNYKWLNNTVGNGNLQSNSIYSIAEDKDGKIWVGTGEGISVFYNPGNIFGGGDFDSQPIKIVQDGNVELLLGKEIVTTIRVDGANNKWCGTQDGGVYCFSPDGQKQIYHFTKENSALYSNTIIDINYDELTGDLFIATDVGLQSYRGIVIAGEEKYSNVYAYPNPVKPNYQGTVLIRGLVDNSVVKIADASGNMVWETKSTGGQIEWPLTTFANSRVTSGVYVVYASTTNGELKAMTKVLVVN